MLSSKKFKIILPLFLFTISVLGWIWYRGQLGPATNGQPEQVSFTIRKNESASSVLTRLQSAGLLRSVFAARIYLRLTGADRQLAPGGYLLSTGLSFPEIITYFSRGPKDIWITIPEGWRREQIGLRLTSVLASPSSDFDLPDFLNQTATLEGRLFPDTYLVPSQISVSEMISLLTRTFILKTGFPYELSLADHRTLIIASLIEREAKRDPDRAIIGGIIIKRLSAGWPLQIDASIQYAADTYRCRSQQSTCSWWQPITATDFVSDFNTYLHPGLPPTPICNPGLASIQAARNPIATPYWYYLTGNDGVTYYATTLADHNRNVDKYLRP